MPNRLIDGVKSAAGLIASVAAAVTIAYGVVVKAGFVIGRAEAQTMIDLAVQTSASQTNAAILDEVKARQAADLQFQLDDANERIAELLDEEDLSKGEEYELEKLKDKASKLEAALTALGQ